jgi:hypothetical protein
MPTIVSHLPAVVYQFVNLANLRNVALIFSGRTLFRPFLTIWLLHWLRSERRRLRPGEVMRFKGLDIEVEYDRRLGKVDRRIRAGK